MKGFAFTLGVGIASLFTAVVFTQAFPRLSAARACFSSRCSAPVEQRVRWHFDFTGLSRWFFSISG